MQENRHKIGEERWERRREAMCAGKRWFLLRQALNEAGVPYAMSVVRDGDQAPRMLSGDPGEVGERRLPDLILMDCCIHKANRLAAVPGVAQLIGAFAVCDRVPAAGRRRQRSRSSAEPERRFRTGVICWQPERV